MPELAEVEKVRSLIETHTLNKTIIKVEALEDDIVFCNKKPKEIEKSLLNSKIVNVCRKGKIFWMELSSSPHISFHLGMTGRMIVRGENILTYYRYPDKNEQNNWPPRFYKLLLTFNDNTQISFCNTRRLGRVRLHKNLPLLEEPISLLGFDPFNSMCSYNIFSDLILKRKCPLKALLLNQSFTAGVGNWIADEVCYQSGIYPGKYCNTLNNSQINRIYNSLKTIVKYAVSVSADYNKFPQNWLFHYRWNKGKNNNDLNNCTDGFGNKIVYEQIGGRTTAIVLELQSKLNGFRKFKNDKKLGKIKSYKKKLKMKNKDELIIDNENKNVNENNNNKKGKKKRKRKNNKCEKIRKNNNKNKLDEPPKKKRNISKEVKEDNKAVYDPKTHVLISNKVLVPVGLLRRSSRLAAKNK